nr:uncharacterized protein LOC128685830 [Cherax quadricarinatus]
MRVATAPAVRPPAGGSPHPHTTHMSLWPPASSSPEVVVGVEVPETYHQWWNEWTNTSDEEAKSLLDVDTDDTLSSGNWTLADENWTLADENWTLTGDNWTTGSDGEQEAASSASRCCSQHSQPSSWA